MSDEQKPSGNEADVHTGSESSSTGQEDEFVPKSAYFEVTRDMHKYKQERRELKAKLSEYEAKVRAEEEARLKEQERWKELSERYEREKREAIEQAQNLKNAIIREKKIQALKSELGGNVRDEYLSFANIDEIEVDESGSLSSESVRVVANKFRQEHGSLIPESRTANITSRSAASTGPVGQPQAKSLRDMTFEERAQYLADLKQGRS